MFNATANLTCIQYDPTIDLASVYPKFVMSTSIGVENFSI